MPHLMKRRTTILIILALVGITSVALFSFIGIKNNQEDNIIVRSDSAWMYPFSSAEELLNDSNVHLVVEATVLPNSRPYQIINEEPPRIVLDRTLTDIRVERIFFNENPTFRVYVISELDPKSNIMSPLIEPDFSMI